MIVALWTTRKVSGAIVVSLALPGGPLNDPKENPEEKLREIKNETYKNSIEDNRDNAGGWVSDGRWTYVLGHDLG
jgi:hypothetical protein